MDTVQRICRDIDKLPPSKRRGLIPAIRVALTAVDALAVSASPDADTTVPVNVHALVQLVAGAALYVRQNQ